MKNIDILAIGDITTDVFIKIKEAETKCDIHGNHCELCLNYGGKIPYESADVCHAAGNSSNFSIAISRLGLKSALMTNIGGDQNGIDCLNVLKDEKVDTTFVKTEIGKNTNYHYVIWYDKEHTILTKHEKYKYEWNGVKESKESLTPSWIYLSSLGEESIDFYSEIINYLNNNTDVKLAFQPGTLQIKLGKEILKDVYAKADLFFSNYEEAQRILGSEMSIIESIKMIYDLGPKIVVITNGAKGAYSYDGNEVLFMNSFPSGPSVETTGAGDAFSSGFMSAIFLGKDISTALVWGASNAVSVISHIGPHKGLLNEEQIKDYIEKHEDNKPVKIN